jgi:hypothetical protein
MNHELTRINTNFLIFFTTKFTKRHENAAVAVALVLKMKSCKEYM